MGHFVYPNLRAKKRARILTPSELKHVLAVAGLTRWPERNRLIVCMTHAMGLRVTELSRITPRDLLYPSGRVREEITLRESITKFNKSRTIPVGNQVMLDALEEYLGYRLRHGLGVVAGATAFRGLSPDLPIILSERGSGFALSRKYRKLVDGSTELYLTCDPLENAFRRLYRSAGLYGASSHSGRRYYASTLLAQGAPIETISFLLGHSSIDHTIPYLVVERDAVIDAYSGAL